MNSVQRTFRFINNHPLAGKHKLKAYYNLIAWQLSQFPSPKEKIVPFVHDTKLFAKKGLAAATGNIYTGLHEFDDMGFLLHLLQPADLFFDIGANIGAYSVLATGVKKSKVVAIEPIPGTFKWLEKNIRLNDIGDKVKPLNIGISGKPGSLNFTTLYDSINHVIPGNVPVEENILKVQVDTIDNIVAKEGCPVLVKIDVEGYETEVIAGMKDTLKMPTLRAIIMELNGSGTRYGFDESAIHEILLENNFRPFMYQPLTRNLKPLETFGSFNTIYLRDLEFVKSRIESSEKINLFSASF